jgi:hypothetical protein
MERIQNAGCLRMHPLRAQSGSCFKSPVGYRVDGRRAFLFSDGNLLIPESEKHARRTVDSSVNRGATLNNLSLTIETKKSCLEEQKKFSASKSIYWWGRFAHF